MRKLKKEVFNKSRYLLITHFFTITFVPYLTALSYFKYNYFTSKYRIWIPIWKLNKSTIQYLSSKVYYTATVFSLLSSSLYDSLNCLAINES